MNGMPGLERLRADLGASYRLTAPSGECVTAQLHTVEPGVPMSPKYCCYCACFALPHGVQWPQAVYTVQANTDAWDLLLAPVGRCGDGRVLLEAVFHHLLPQASAGQTLA